MADFRVLLIQVGRSLRLSRNHPHVPSLAAQPEVSPDSKLRFLFVICLASYFCFSTASIAQAATTSTLQPPSGPVVEMEPYIVKGDRILPDPESWFYTKIPALLFERGSSSVIVPGYEVLSPYGKTNTLAFVSELQLLQLANALLLPGNVRALPRSAIILVWDDDNKLRTNTKAAWAGDTLFTTRAFSHRARMPDVRYFVGTRTVTTGNRITEIPSAYTGTIDRELANADESVSEDDVSETEYAKLNTALARNGGPLTVYIDNSYGFARPDAAARAVWSRLNGYAISTNYRNTPEWLIAGLARLYDSVEVTHKTIDFGRAAFGFPPTNAGEQTAMLDNPFEPAAPPNAPAPPISNRARAQRDNPSIMLPKLADIFNGERTLSYELREPQMAAAFVHYSLYGDNGAYQKNFFQFIERLQNEPFSEKLFQDCFKRKISRYESALSTYIRSFAFYKSTQYKGKLPQMPDVILRGATQSEVARLKAEVLAAQGWVPAALDELRVAYWRGERDPEMLALLAFLEEHIGLIPRAQKITRTLLALPQPPVRAYLVAAKLRLRELGVGEDSAKKLNRAEADSVFDLIIKARERGLLNEDLCATLAKLILNSAEPTEKEIASFLAEAAKSYPRNKIIAAAHSATAPMPETFPSS